MREVRKWSYFYLLDVRIFYKVEQQRSCVEITFLRGNSLRILKPGGA